VTTTFRLTAEDIESAPWINCGPAALCALLEMTPSEIRPHLLHFEEKGYTNPMLMKDILCEMDREWKQTYRSDKPHDPGCCPAIRFGLMRVQWGGPWCKPGVPMAARYRKTHWVAMKPLGAPPGGAPQQIVFDINAIHYGGWLSFREWSTELVPWLIKQCCPKGDGTWWPTHCLEVTR
jgi:hypothetical protein